MTIHRTPQERRASAATARKVRFYIVTLPEEEDDNLLLSDENHRAVLSAILKNAGYREAEVEIHDS